MSRSERSQQLRRLLDDRLLPTIHRPATGSKRRDNHILEVSIPNGKTFTITISDSHYVIYTPVSDDTGSEIFARTPFPETAARQASELWGREFEGNYEETI